MNISCVIPTRGDVPLEPVLARLPFDDVVVYDNSRRPDLGIYGRYQAIQECKHDVIATLDDDVVVTDWEAIVGAYEPGVLTVNYPQPWDIPWVARGAVFDRGLPAEAFTRYLAEYDFDRLFTHRICDAVFALLTERVNVIDVGSEDLPHGFAAGRVSTSPGWYDRDRPEAQRRCEALKVAA